MSERRWHPLLQQWVLVATHRQERTFLPPKDYCPLCPTHPGGFPTEVPSETYEIVAFENKFPSMRREAGPPSLPDTGLYHSLPGQGICEVLLYTPTHEGTLTDRPIEDIEKLVWVWADRTLELAEYDFVKYVFIFENKGTVIGVTLTHPHGQIYAYPFIPPVLEKEIVSARQHFAQKQRCLFCDILEEEIRGQRLVATNPSWVAFVPFFARYPYEVYLMPRRHLGWLPETTPTERRDLAQILKALLLKYDNLWGFSLPYIMALHQRPVDGQDYPFYHLHFEFYPPHRTRDKLKYLAGSESGAGVFINDTFAEEKAEELRRAKPETELPEARVNPFTLL